MIKRRPEHLLELENVIELRDPVRIENSNGRFGDIVSLEGLNDASSSQADTDRVVASFSGGEDFRLDFASDTVNDVSVEAGCVLSVHSGAGFLSPPLFEDRAEFQAIEPACDEDDVGSEFLHDWEGYAFESGQNLGVPVAFSQSYVDRVSFSAGFFYMFTEHAAHIAIKVGSRHHPFREVTLGSVGFEPPVAVEGDVENGLTVSENKLGSVAGVDIEVENGDSDGSFMSYFECRIVDLQEPLQSNSKTVEGAKPHTVFSRCALQTVGRADMLLKFCLRAWSCVMQVGRI